MKAPHRKAFLIYGSPCSGKSNCVTKHAKSDDVIIDIDRLHMAISPLPLHERNDNLTAVVYAMQDAISTHIARGLWHGGDVWVITCAAKRSQRQRWRRELGAEPRLIKADRSTCLARAKRERPTVWQEYIDRWFYDYEPE